MPAVPMGAIQAYVDHARFGVLPFSGGSFEQPAELMEELHLVAEIVERARARAEEQMRKRAGSKSSSSPRRKARWRPGRQR